MELRERGECMNTGIPMHVLNTCVAVIASLTHKLHMHYYTLPGIMTLKNQEFISKVHAWVHLLEWAFDKEFNSSAV